LGDFNVSGGRRGCRGFSIEFCGESVEGFLEKIASASRGDNGGVNQGWKDIGELHYSFDFGERVWVSILREGNGDVDIAVRLSERECDFKVLSIEDRQM